MRPFQRLAAATATGVAALTLGTGVASAGGDASLAELRGATARYHNFAVATAEGFVDLDGECVTDPALGGMGVHYGRVDRFDDTLELSEPGTLLYEPSQGGNRLVGVEYVVAAPLDQPPSLLGQAFAQGPEIGDGIAIWSLHVWVWRHNPAGMFAAYNPEVRCP